MPRPGGTSTSAGAGGGDPDDGRLGDLARGFLRPTPYTRVAVQIDEAGDAAPSRSVVQRMLSVLRDATQKPVDQVDGQHLAGKGPNGCWSIDDIARADEVNRDAHTRGTTVALHALFLDGKPCNDPNGAGLAFSASGIAVFTHQAESAAHGAVSPDVYVRVAATHEIGHVLGLVNIGYHSVHPHEDAQHPGHSNDDQSVMYWAIDRVDLLSALVFGPPQDFDSDDKDDLAGLRDGRY